MHKTLKVEMASKSTSSKQKLFIFFIFFLSLALLLLTTTLQPSLLHNDSHCLKKELSKGTYPWPIQNHKYWYNIIAKQVKWRKIKIGLVNMKEIEEEGLVYKLHGLGETINVRFDRVAEDRGWEDYFPTWIDEDEKRNKPSCPEIPMPRFEDYREVDVVVARVPCGNRVENKGVRDVFRLQVNLVVANLVVMSGWMMKYDIDRTVYVVFIGSCGPMREIFRCDDLLSHEGDYWVYKPNLRRLKQKMLMPVGTCQLALPFAQPGKEQWRTFISQSTLSKLNNTINQFREAYVTILHSSEAYVCGAIALAQSIIRTDSTKDLVLLADDSITKKSLQGLKIAGWKIKHIKRIKSPHAAIDAYNEWNYSKLRIWQLTEYDKVIFLDSDLLVLENIDDFFIYPELSAIGNDNVLFNSGVMLVEPSKCMFETLMEERYSLSSYNGGDQGFLNEVFTWWHRWPSRLNHLKFNYDNTNHEIPKDLYAIHYLGLKPWMCYKDYDCNWDMLDHHRFASDSAHQRWWQVYEAMPKILQSYCGLTKTMNTRIKMWRRRARNASLPDGHWKIKVRDPRQHPSNFL